MRKQPSFAALAVLALALGIGAATTIFSVLQNVLIDPFPYTNAERVVTILIHDVKQSGIGGRSFGATGKKLAIGVSWWKPKEADREMNSRVAHNLTYAKAFVRAAAALAAVAGPVAIGILPAPACHAQAQAGTTSGLTFEVASIKLSNADPGSSGIKTGHGRLDAKNVTLKRCIMGAYGIGPHQISGGPDWLESDRFEIWAKADRPINDDAMLMVMLQGLLAERFKLVLHRETKIIPAFVLEVAKNGPKLEKADDGEAGTNTISGNTGITIDAHHTGMDSFAKILARQMELPVINQTALEGIFNFKLHWTRESARAVDGGALEGLSIFTAIQEQLGLRLRSQKAPVEILVIDHVEKPSEN